MQECLAKVVAKASIKCGQVIYQTLWAMESTLWPAENLVINEFV